MFQKNHIFIFVITENILFSNLHVLIYYSIFLATKVFIRLNLHISNSILVQVLNTYFITTHQIETEFYYIIC